MKLCPNRRVFAFKQSCRHRNVVVLVFDHQLSLLISQLYKMDDCRSLSGINVHMKMLSKVLTEQNREKFNHAVFEI